MLIPNSSKNILDERRNSRNRINLKSIDYNSLKKEDPMRLVIKKKNSENAAFGVEKDLK